MRALVVVVLAAGCAGAEVRQRAVRVEEAIATARAGGAETCAPVELAMAESHRDFALTELDEGDSFRAREEIAVAETNAALAVRRSGGPRCTGAAPADGDRDRDGISDRVDECPDRPEDKDGHDDGDGCPDLDNDNDGLVDKVDDCPDEAEDKDGKGDDDGCPDCDDDGDGVPECPTAIDRCPDQPAATADGCPAYKNVVVTATRIELKQTVFFDTDKTSIKRVSFELLDEVAQALRDNPTIAVRIEGHTDSQGKDAYNLRLSKGRAKAVRDYLVRAGIDGKRMVSEGYGEGQPIADNRTADGRSQNRRVEFVITGR